MKTRKLEIGLRMGRGWSNNHWIISNRLGPQGQQTQDEGWAAAAVATLYVPRSSATAVANLGPTRRQRAAESGWENEGGATQPPMRCAD